MAKEKKVYKKNPNMVERKIEDEIVLVPIKKDAADLDAIYNLNNVTSIRIWELIDGKKSVREIENKILEEFDVSEKDLENDLQEFIQDLEEIGAIE